MARGGSPVRNMKARQAFAERNRESKKSSKTNVNTRPEDVFGVQQIRHSKERL